MIRLYLFILLLLSLLSVKAQKNYSLFKTFTTNDGLPSNHIYTCVEDNSGFLWIATDAGIARFDGKHFQVFTVQNGLPDDEVMQVVKEKNGRIWVNCFKQSPAYFDPIKNRFINTTEDSNLAKVKVSSFIFLSALLDGGVMFTNETGSYIFKEGKLSVYPVIKRSTEIYIGNIIQQKNSGITIRQGVITTATGSENYIYRMKKDVVLDSIQITKDLSATSITFINENKLYYLNASINKCYIYSFIDTNSLKYTMDSIQFTQPVFMGNFTDKYLVAVGRFNSIFVYNKKTLAQEFTIEGSFSTASFYNDKNENIWVGTVDRGLLLYKRKVIETVKMPEKYTNTHFLSIARKSNGTLLAGNYYGEVLETDAKSSSIRKLSQVFQGCWQRKIIHSQNKVFTFSEGGCLVNYKTPILMAISRRRLTLKTAIAFNDSIIIGGHMSGLYKINTQTEKSTKLNSPLKRVTSICKLPSNKIYFGSTDGLYKYDYKNDTGWSLTHTHILLAERVVSLASTKDGLLCMGTASKGLIVLQNDKIVSQITETEGLISNTIRNLIAIKSNQIWVGTSQGISILNYSFTKNNFNYSIQNISINDGLSSNIINEMMYQNDTVFVATGNGITIIPANIFIPKFNIPVQLIKIRINQRDTSIAAFYQLKNNQQNIELSFAAIELSGHCKNFQYQIDNDENWVDLADNILNLQLNSGNHILQVRAVDVNKNISDKILRLSFNIATPFWKSIWFYSLILCVVFATIFYFIQRKIQRKQAATIQKIENQQRLAEMEMQAIKAQINPHFIFNCLNSLKSLNYQKRYAEADSYTDKFSLLLRNTLDFSGADKISLQSELNYITNYIELEKMRFGNKLQYHLNVQEMLNTSNVFIPALLLQPYVENAIRHGIGNLIKTNGLLTIDVYSTNGDIEIKIEDNGVGREKAAQINKAKADYHQSLGLSLTEKRASLYHITSTVNDKKDDTGKSIGTCVLLKIPYTKN